MTPETTFALFFCILKVMVNVIKWFLILSFLFRYLSFPRFFQGQPKYKRGKKYLAGNSGTLQTTY